MRLQGLAQKLEKLPAAGRMPLLESAAADLRAADRRSMAVETGLMTLHEDEFQGILQVLAQIARTGDVKDRLDPSSFQSRLSTLPRRARFTVSQALSALAAQAPTESSDKPTLLKLRNTSRFASLSKATSAAKFRSTR